MGELSPDYLARVHKAAEKPIKQEIEDLLTEIGRDVGVDFDALLDERKALRTELEEDDRRSIRWVNAVEEKSKEELQATLRRVLERATDETELEEVLGDIMPVTAISDFAEYISQNSVRVVKGKTALGSHHPIFGIELSDDVVERASSPEYVLANLAAGGGSRGADVLFHEFVHGVQPEAKSALIKRVATCVMEQQAIFWGLQCALNGSIHADALSFLAAATSIAVTVKLHSVRQQLPKILEEVHAFSAGSEISNRSSSRYSDMVKNLEEYGWKSERIIDQIVSATRSIRHLRALGFSHRAIGQTVGASHWDEQTKSFDEVERLIEEEAKKRNLDRIQLDTLADADLIKRDILLLKLAKIARQELEHSVAK
jgi:hypothetical protein